MAISDSPWKMIVASEKFHGYEDWQVYDIRDGHNQCIAVIGEIDHGTASSNLENANLFLAAPDLLFAVEAGLKEIQMLDGFSSVVEASSAVLKIMRDAIAKAKGETNAH